MATNRSSIIDDTLTQTSSLLSGFNIDKAGIRLAKNRDNIGYIFFTRPDLNLSDSNLKNDRRFLRMLNDQSVSNVGTQAENISGLSMHKALRHMLDPDQFMRYGKTTDIYNDKQAFLTILTGALESASGFPDESINIASSSEGIRKETSLSVDGVSDMLSQFSISLNINNLPGGIIVWLFDYWIKYCSNVLSDYRKMTTKFDNILTKRKDYETGIYRLVTDYSGTYVQGIAYTIGIPKNSSRGLLFNYVRDKEHNDDADMVSVTIECQGIEYDDPILYREFNQKVAIFNPAMADDYSTDTTGEVIDIAAKRKRTLVKLNQHEKPNYRFQAYPYINQITLELEWWVEKSIYKS